MALTAGIGVDRVVDAVGVDAVHAQRGPAASPELSRQGEEESRTVTPQRDDGDGHWIPGDAPTQALDWAVSALAKAGTLGVIGVYPPTDRFFPIGAAMNKNLTVKMGNCNHRAVTPELIERVRNGSFDPLSVLTTREPLLHVIDAYKAFDQRQPGWIKVALEPLA
jgi:threonine dehydrogenase-like Zn-dependent dehydrogenase